MIGIRPFLTAMKKLDISPIRAIKDQIWVACVCGVNEAAVSFVITHTICHKTFPTCFKDTFPFCSKVSLAF